MEAAVQGLAAIIINAYRGAAESRGARGTAGSGSGTRTLVDGLSLSMAHNHWLAINHLDLHASLPLQIPEDDDDDAGGRRRGGCGSAGEEGETDGAEECTRVGLSRGFEAPPLDAAKVKWMSRLLLLVFWLFGQSCLQTPPASPLATRVCCASQYPHPTQEVLLCRGLDLWKLQHQTNAHVEI